MKLIPLHDNVFIERDVVEEKKTPGGIVLPEESQKQPDTATVIAVGEGRILANGTKVVPTVKVGDKILVGPFSGTQVNWELETRIVIPWGDILGVVEDFEVIDTDTDTDTDAPKEDGEKS